MSLEGSQPSNTNNERKVQMLNPNVPPQETVNEQKKNETTESTNNEIRTIFPSQLPKRTSVKRSTSYESVINERTRNRIFPKKNLPLLLRKKNKFTNKTLITKTQKQRTRRNSGIIYLKPQNQKEVNSLQNQEEKQEQTKENLVNEQKENLAQDEENDNQEEIYHSKNETHEIGETNKPNERNETNKTDTISQTIELNELSITNEINETNGRYETGELNETSELNEVNEIDEINETNKTDQISQTIELNEINITNEINETNGRYETGELNETIELNEPNEIDEPNETDELQYLNPMNEKRNRRDYDRRYRRARRFTQGVSQQIQKVLIDGKEIDNNTLDQSENQILNYNKWQQVSRTNVSLLKKEARGYNLNDYEIIYSQDFGNNNPNNTSDNNDNVNQEEKEEEETNTNPVFESNEFHEYSERHFANSKSGLRRRKAKSVSIILNYSPNKLQSPITQLETSEENKIAIKTFKYLLYFIGEMKWTKKYKKRKIQGKEGMKVHFEQNEAIKKIIEFGFTMKNLRDEIYLQILKQITNNPDIHSTLRGWGALCLVIQTFPPTTQELSNLLNALFEYYCESTDKYLRRYSKYAQIKLQSIVTKKSGFLMPTDEMIRRIFAVPYDPIVFNVTLEDCMQTQKKKFPNEIIPHILSFLVNKIKQTGGFEKEGIFRIPGNAQKISELKDMLDRGVYHDEDLVKDKEMNNPFVYGSLLKMWFRELFEPIIPYKFHQQIIDSRKTDEIIQIAESLPKVNKYTLAFSISLFKEMQEESILKVTKMNIDNLVLMFAPNIVNMKYDSENILLFTKFAQKQNNFINQLIENWDISDYLIEIQNSANSIDNEDDDDDDDDDSGGDGDGDGENDHIKVDIISENNENDVENENGSVIENLD
ncbi:rho gtpase activation protein [Anaeramoeba flamelloides]|uniref:Rho gtpase activation protein n=1 Tax=Anaeramoeba flamelloides TaxID=1746091 RepID=A0ABQ8ZEG5_9EUKA|nr:rho gtpase activation protein [Anaeramoeba flamelloides]